MGFFLSESNETYQYISDVKTAFEGFRHPDDIELDIELPFDKNNEELSKALNQLEKMIFDLSSGDITKKKMIELCFDITDYIEWFSMKKFDSYCEKEIYKRQK